VDVSAEDRRSPPTRFRRMAYYDPLGETQKYEATRDALRRAVEASTPQAAGADRRRRRRRSTPWFLRRSAR